MRNLLVPILFFSASLSACGTYTPTQVAQPSNITLRKAVFDVATTLRDVQASSRQDQKVGLIADEATVTFNIAASSKTTNNGELSVSNVPLARGVLQAKLGSENISEGSTGNQITIKFKNITTADMSKGIYSVAGSGKGKAASSSSNNNKPATLNDKFGEVGGIDLNIPRLCQKTGACVLSGKVPASLRIPLDSDIIIKNQYPPGGQDGGG